MTDQTTDSNLTDQQQKEAPAPPPPSPRNLFDTASNTASVVYDTLATPFRQKQKAEEIRAL